METKVKKTFASMCQEKRQQKKGKSVGDIPDHSEIPHPGRFL